MKKRTEGFDTIEWKKGQQRYTILVCTECTKAWRLPAPAEEWKIKALLLHYQSHRPAGVKVSGLQVGVGVDDEE